VIAGFLFPLFGGILFTPAPLDMAKLLLPFLNQLLKFGTFGFALLTDLFPDVPELDFAKFFTPDLNLMKPGENVLACADASEIRPRRKQIKINFVKVFI